MAEPLPDIVRIVSGKGIITIPESYFSALQISLYVQVLREPRSPSKNFTWNPDRSFYAHVAFCIDDFVLRGEDVNFASQVFDIHNGQDSQNLLSLICAYDGILDSFVSIGNVIGVVLSRTNLIKAHPYLRMPINRIRFECFASTALKLTLKGIALSKCTLEDGDSTPPPPPPPPVELVPPSTPVVTSPAEDGDSDGGDTVPDPLDQPDIPPPVPGACEPAVLNYTFTNAQFPAGLTADIQIGLPFEGFRQSEGQNPGSISVEAVASATIGDFCVPGQGYGIIANADPEGLSIVANSITPG